MILECVICFGVGALVGVLVGNNLGNEDSISRDDLFELQHNQLHLTKKIKELENELDIEKSKVEREEKTVDSLRRENSTLFRLIKEEGYALTYVGWTAKLVKVDDD